MTQNLSGFHVEEDSNFSVSGQDFCVPSFPCGDVMEITEFQRQIYDTENDDSDDLLSL